MATTDRILGLTGTRGMKDPCVVATTANITLSGIQTIDGIVLQAEDRVLVKDQTDGSENGIYIVASGAWVRAPDWDGDRDVRQGTMMSVGRGTVNANQVFHVTTNDPITVGTTSINIGTRVALSGVSTFVSTIIDDSSAGEVLDTLGITAFAQTILDDANAAAARTTLGITTVDPIPSGTVMLFFQASAPTGFTQVTDHNDKAFRVVSGTGGGTGGTVAFETAFASQVPTGTNAGTALTTAQLPAHTHTIQYANTSGSGATGALLNTNKASMGTQNTGSQGSGDTHTHTFTGDAINLDVSYINIILASKD